MKKNSSYTKKQKRRTQQQQSTGRSRPKEAMPKNQTRREVPNRTSEPQRTSTQERGNQKKRRNPPRQSKLLPVFVFMMIGFYLSGQLITMATGRNEVGTETVLVGNLDVLQEYDGLIVREEYLLPSPSEGHVQYVFSEGDRVSKNSVVAVISDTDTTQYIEEKLEEIDQNILNNQKNRMDISIYSEDVARLNDTIQKLVNNNVQLLMDESMTAVHDLKSRLQSSMNQRNQIWLTEDVDSLSQLTDEKFRYEAQLAENMTSVATPHSGIISLSYDNLEEVLTPSTVSEIKQAQIGKSTIETLSRNQLVTEEEPVIKVVANNQWYIVSYLPNTKILDWKVNSIKTIGIGTGQSDTRIELSARIVSITQGEAESKVVFSTYEHIDTFMNERLVKIYTEMNVTSGLKVPQSALIEKSLIEIPYASLVEENRSQGVYLQSDLERKFVPVSVITSSPTHYYIEQTNDVKLGDVILVMSSSFSNAEEGMAFTEHTISALKPMSGVYLANSAVAKFTSIEILEQNKEYAIVRSGTTYGLQMFDTIVSDAKNVAEGDTLY
ncbi:MAG: HlyD family efflux transporter periplasmic adaptor subunit [Bacillota bacterium]